MERTGDLWSEWQRIVAVDEPDPLTVAELAARFERYFDAVKTEAVRVARATGATWEEVAAAVGTSRQSAWQRYRRQEKFKEGKHFVVRPPLMDTP